MTSIKEIVREEERSGNHGTGKVDSWEFGCSVPIGGRKKTVGREKPTVSAWKLVKHAKRHRGRREEADQISGSPPLS